MSSCLFVTGFLHSNVLVLQATQRDLLDRQSQLDQLHRKSEDLHRCLPGSSSELANKEMDEIYDQIHFIDKEIGLSMKKKAGEKEPLSGHASPGLSFEDRSLAPDTVSVSSAGGPSLALEVQVSVFNFLVSNCYLGTFV